MRRVWRGTAGASVMAATLWTAPAMAQVSLPPVNLGDTSFLDGVAGPGGLIEETLSVGTARSFRDGRGRRAATPRDLSTVSALTHIAYISHQKVFGAYWGAEIVLPVARVALDVAPGVRGRTTGVGDLFISPVLLQWPEQRLFGRPFWQRLNLNVSVPTGRYSSRRLVSAGSNVVQVNPHYAFTWMASDTWDVSGRLHYLWVSANDDPPDGLGARSIQPGQALHANLSLSRAVADGLRLGLSGYVLQQITSDRIDGVAQKRSRERIVGIGPGVQWRHDAVTLTANAYWETAARDRPEQIRVLLRFSHTF